MRASNLGPSENQAKVGITSRMFIVSQGKTNNYLKRCKVSKPLSHNGDYFRFSD